MNHLLFLAALALCALAGQFLSGPSLELFNLVSMAVFGLALAVWFARLMQAPTARHALAVPAVMGLGVAALIPVTGPSGQTLSQWGLSLLG